MLLISSSHLQSKITIFQMNVLASSKPTQHVDQDAEISIATTIRTGCAQPFATKAVSVSMAMLEMTSAYAFQSKIVKQVRVST